MNRLLEFVIVSHGVDRLYRFPSSPWGRNLQSRQETWLLTLIKDSDVKSTNNCFFPGSNCKVQTFIIFSVSVSLKTDMCGGCVNKGFYFGAELRRLP